MKRVTNQTVDLSGLETGQADIETKIDLVKTDTEAIETDTISIESKVDSLKTDTTAIESKVDLVKADTESIETKSDTISGKCDVIESDVTQIKSNTNNIDSKCNDIRTDIGSIQADIDIIKDDAKDSKDNSDKISNIAVAGLGDVVDSLAYRVAESERHVHSYARFFEKAITPSGETHAADELGYGAGPFRLQAGNNDFGPWVLLFGSSDTPFAVGSIKYDFHEIQVEDTQRTNTYIIQISFAETGNGGIAAKTYSTRPYTPQSIQIDTTSLLTQAKRQLAGTKVWARCKCRGETSGYIDIIPGFHEYEG